jgi:hypothetical protein
MRHFTRWGAGASAPFFKVVPNLVTVQQGFIVVNMLKYIDFVNFTPTPRKPWRS